MTEKHPIINTKLPSAPLTFVVIAALGTLLRLLFVWSGWCEGTLIADDAYYYFKIAKNIAAGAGSTFDGLSQTNGYHPLWTALLVPVFKLAGDSLWLPVRISLTLCVLFDVLSGFLIYRLIGRAGLKIEALVASLFWFLIPFPLFLGLRGMEASLSTTIILLVTYTMIVSATENGRRWIKGAIIIGVLIGIAGLARTDNLISVGLTVALVSIWFFHREVRSVVRGFAWLTTSALTAVVLVIPWFLWNYIEFGNMIQVSGQVKFYSKGIYGAMLVDWGNITGIIKSLSYPLLAPIIFPSRFLSGEEFRQPAISFLIVLGFLSSIVVPLFVVRKELKSKLRGTLLEYTFLFGFTYMIIHTVIFGFVWRSYATWYAMPYFGFLAIIFGVTFPTFLKRISSRKIIKSAAIVSVLLLHFSVYFLFITRMPHTPRRPAIGWQKNLTAISKQYPDKVVVGAFNAGAVAWAAQDYPSITLTNLDCLVNNNAFEFVKRGKYLDYLLSTVDVLIEDPKNASMFLNSSEVDSLCQVFQKWDGFRIWSQ